MRLKNQVAIVTGGSSGIGRGICLELSREGAVVVVADIREAPKRGRYHERETATSTLEEIEKMGGTGLFVQTDISNEAAAKRLIDATITYFNNLDIIVNNAGIFLPGGTLELSIQDWDRIVGLNLRGVFLMTRFAVPHLMRSARGRIVNIASIHAFGGGGGPAYAPAKAGVVNLTRDTAVELGRHNITVNVICPGYIETAIQDYLTLEQIQECRDRTPLPRLGVPRDIGQAVVFLASEDAGWITGAVLPVDGGWSARA